MFKSEAGKKEEAIAKETVRSELQKDVQLYDVLKKYLTIYLATVAIPNYKKQRIEAYVRAMGRMADAEVRNAENTYDCWNNFQKTILSYNIKYWEKKGGPSAIRGLAETLCDAAGSCWTERDNTKMDSQVRLKR